MCDLLFVFVCLESLLKYKMHKIMVAPAVIISALETEQVCMPFLEFEIAVLTEACVYLS